MSGVFQIIDPPHSPHRPTSVYPLPLVLGEDTLAGCRGGLGVNILEDARHSSVLYICKYYVIDPFETLWTVMEMQQTGQTKEAL